MPKFEIGHDGDRYVVRNVRTKVVIGKYSKEQDAIKSLQNIENDAEYRRIHGKPKKAKMFIKPKKK